MSRPRYWFAGTLTAICLAVAANAQVVSQVVNTVALGGITGLGTNVATALGIAVGSAGGPVTFNGAGGTPSSMTATNLSGTASGLTAGNVTGLTANGTAAVGQLPGTTTNDSAAAGKVGELLENSAALNSVSLTTVTGANAGTLSLTAGDWETTCTVYFLPAASTTVSYLWASVSASSNTANLTIGFFGSASYPALVLGNGIYTTMQSPPVKVSLSGTTSYYCVANASFGISTMAAGGVLHARRLR